jgi:hypothetical protein
MERQEIGIMTGKIPQRPVIKTMFLLGAAVVLDLVVVADPHHQQA